DAELGHIGNALQKRYCYEWRFYPALEAEFSFILNWWAAKAQGTFREIEELEHLNLKEGREDYKHYQTDNEFGRNKEELALRLTEEAGKYGELFYHANAVLNQHCPNVGSVNEHRIWSWKKIAPDSSDSELAADNYRSLGPRPSTIDEFLHAILKICIEVWTKAKQPLITRSSSNNKSMASTPVSHKVGYTTLHILSHLLVVVMAVLFFVCPLSVMYLVPMSGVAHVLVTISFSLLFCVGSFYFGGGSGGLKTDTKFLLLFAYTSVMATLLSNLAEHQENFQVSVVATNGRLKICQARTRGGG
ncbi:hypothetical protein QBC36DRAFT_364102, partial [Triangularia setosa]